MRGDKTLTDTNQSIPIKARFSRMREVCEFECECKCVM